MTRFAFYGRVSTEDQQDPASSRNWQLTRARQLIEPTNGEVVEEFFDIGQSRSLPWSRRPEASRLLAALAEPSRKFDAIVIGEPQRAFYGNQFGLTFPVLVHYGVQLWVPEIGGAIDPGSDAHEIVMSLYGGMSKGERNRIKTRVRSAMASQAAIEGRYLGGRPPYGYLLGDAGPHPNPSKAAIGQRLRRLEPDAVAAPVVLRIFEEFVAGAGLFTIARQLTEEGVRSPSAHDPERNRHRAGSAGLWAKSAVRAILGNPRYTGRQVWNRQRRDEILIDVRDVALGHETRMRWNDRDAWVWSQELTHEPLVSVELYEQVQAQFETTRRASTRTPKEGRHYVLAGLMTCGKCGRRMHGAWNHGHPNYRCQFSNQYAIDPTEHPRTLSVNEASLVPGLDRWLGSLFEPERLDDTCAALAAVSDPAPPDPTRENKLRAEIAKCDRELDGYREVVRNEPDTRALVGRWIADTMQRRRRLEQQLGVANSTGAKLTTADVKALVASLKDIVATLADADPTDKAAVYRELGIHLTYNHDGRVLVEARPRVVNVRVGGGT